MLDTVDFKLTRILPEEVDVARSLVPKSVERIMGLDSGDVDSFPAFVSFDETDVADRDLCKLPIDRDESEVIVEVSEVEVHRGKHCWHVPSFKWDELFCALMFVS